MTKLLIATLITLCSTYAAYAQQAQQCQILTNGTIFCTPAGGQPSIYRP